MLEVIVSNTATHHVNTKKQHTGNKLPWRAFHIIIDFKTKLHPMASSISSCITLGQFFRGNPPTALLLPEVTQTLQLLSAGDLGSDAGSVVLCQLFRRLHRSAMAGSVLPKRSLMRRDMPDIPHHMNQKRALDFIHMCSDKHVKHAQATRSQQEKKTQVSGWRQITDVWSLFPISLLCIILLTLSSLSLRIKLSRLTGSVSPLTMTGMLLT